MKRAYFLTSLCILVFISSNLFAQNTYVPDDNFEQALIDLGYDSGALNDSVPTDSINSISELIVSGKGILDLSGIESFAALNELNFSNNQVSTVDLSYNNNLVTLTCYNNELSDLNLSANTIIETINCSNNQITTLNLSSNTSLKYINCSNNQLTSLNLKNGNNQLMTGDDYRITGIDTRSNPNLYCLQIDNHETAATNLTWYKDVWTEYQEDCSAYNVEMTYVPDDNFEQALIDLGYDTGELNDSLPLFAIKSITDLNIRSKNISNLKGIEDFQALSILFCENNKLTSLDLHNNSKLRYLICSSNNLTSLDLSANNLLTLLYCNDNNIIDLDLSANSFLTELQCIRNQLTGLNIRNGNNNNLYIFTINNPNLFCIEVDDATTAEGKNWNKNAYSAYSEDCSNFKLEMTYVPDDNFEQALIVKGLDPGPLNDSVPTHAISRLTHLGISYKNISDLTGIEDFTSLEQFYCSHIQISELNLKTNTNLKVLKCNNNSIVELDLSSNTSLTSLTANSNNLSGLNLRNGNNSNLTIRVTDNPNLFCIEVDDSELSYTYSNWYKSAYAGYAEDCSNYKPKMTYLPDDNFEQALINLGYDRGELNDSVPTHVIKYLKSLNVSNKNISDLTGIEEFIALEQLYCYGNQISELNLKTNTNLKVLQCQNNSIVELDLSSNTSLISLRVYNNNLSGLNLRNGNNSNLTIRVTDNPNLFCIEVDDSELSYTYSNWYKNAYTAYTQDCSNYKPEMTYVPDDNFEQALINLGYDRGELNDSVPIVAINKLTSLSINYKNISDLTGIEDFIALEQLNCYGNQISELNLKTNINLKVLQCNNNSIVELDLSSNTSLTSLTAYNNNLSGLNLRNGNNSNLTIRVTDNPNLFCIEVDDPELSYTYSNWYKNGDAAYAEDCSNYKPEMTYVPDDNFEQALIYLGHDSGELNDSVPTHAIKYLKYLNVSNKNISDLTGIEGFIALEQLYCSSNQISELNLKTNINLKDLQCQSNNIIELDLSQNKSLTSLRAYNNDLSGLNLRNGNNNKLYIDARNNPNLFCIEVDDPELSYTYSNWYKSVYAGYAEDCSNYKPEMTYVPDDNFEQALINLGYDSGELNDSVPTPAIKYLKSLNVSNKNISDLTGIEDFIALEQLNCYSNQIAELNLKTNTNLEILQCYSNGIVELDLSSNTSLTNVEAYDNNLSGLNLRNGNNANLEIKITGNPNLLCVEVDDENLSNNNENWYKDDFAEYREDCSSYKPKMTYIPDDNFEQALIDLGYDSGELDDSIPTHVVYNITSLDVSGQNISNMQGIQNFVKLTRLECQINEITELNLNENTELQILFCGANELTLLNIDSLSKLEFLNCETNELTSLNLSNNIQLSTLSCSTNPITELNLSFNINLEYIVCETNLITSLDLRSNSNLLTLDCRDNQLTSLDLSQNPKLITLNCRFNNLSDLNIKNGNNFALGESYFYADNNPNLTCIQVDDKNAAGNYTNWNIDTQSYYSENCGAFVSGIPLAEYNTLINLYNSTDGEYWTNNTNWLDTINASVNDWYGITVEDGHVTKIELPNNNLQEQVFANTTYLPELQVLNLAGNKLQDASFSNINQSTKLTTLNIENNKLLFKHISPVFQLSYFSALSEGFTFAPQTNIGTAEDVVKTVGENHVFELSEEFISENDQFQWYKYPNTLLSGENNSILAFEAITKADSGNYYVQITNPNVPNLTLTSNYKSLYVGSAQGAGIPLSEYNALVDFYNNLDGDNWLRNDNWLDTVYHSVGDWFGITVESEHVTEIYFDAIYNYNLNGSLPNSIKELKQLKKLRIITDNVNGKMPAGLFELKNLEELYLSECKISGSLPSSIGNLTQLKVLGLEANQLSGTIPKELGDLSNLEYVSLYENQFSGTIPESFGQLSKLYSLHLEHNNLSGTIPASLGNLSELEWLLLDHNQLIGPVPEELGQLSKIIKLTFNDNLIGVNNATKSANLTSSDEYRQIPDALANLMDMDTFRIAGNNLQFNDIEAIFYWNNFKDFNDFIYSPQNKIGDDKTLTKLEGDKITLLLDNYYSGKFDQCSWYKNGELLDSNSPTLTIDNCIKSDEGSYVCLINNTVASELTLQSGTFTVEIEPRIIDSIPSTYIPDDYFEAALIGLGIDTDGLNDSVKTYRIADIDRLELVDKNISDLTGIEGFVSLESLVCSNNQISKLDLSSNTLLSSLVCQDNDLSELDLSHNKMLTYLECYNNQLQKIDISSNPELTILRCWKNQLSELDVSNNNKLTELDCGWNTIKHLDMGNKTKLGHLSCRSNELESLDLSNSLELWDIACSSNNLKTLNVDSNSKLHQIFCDRNQIRSMDVSHCPNLTKLFCFENNLTYLNIRNGNNHNMVGTESWEPGMRAQGNPYLSCIEVDDPIAVNEYSNWMKDIFANYSIDCYVENTEIIAQEYDALVNLYNGANGSNWLNNTNWLDTVNASVSDWTGITVKNGHVVAIDLSGLNIEGEVFDLFSAFDSLTWLNLSNNQLSGKFPTFNGSKSGNTKSIEENAYNLSYLNIAHNNFMFSDWEQVADELLSIDTFIYSPQQLIGNSIDTTMYKYEDLIVNIKGFVNGINDTYRWFKNEELLTNTASEISIGNASLQDSGIYILNVANSTFPELSLESAPYKLSVLVPVGIEDNKVNEIEIYPNPANDRIFINTGGKEINLKIMGISGSIIFEQSKLNTGWLNIQHLPNGIYFFRMETEDAHVINKKVVIQ